jgi:hypothetical protein
VRQSRFCCLPTAVPSSLNSSQELRADGLYQGLLILLGLCRLFGAAAVPMRPAAGVLLCPETLFGIPHNVSAVERTSSVAADTARKRRHPVTSLARMLPSADSTENNCGSSRRPLA